MHRTVAAALVAALALALASCGGSGTRTLSGASTADRPATLSRAELVRRLETACLAVDARSYKARPSSNPRAYVRYILANQQYVLKRVGNLETTGPAKAAFDAFKDVLRKRVAALERVASASGADFWRVVAKERPAISAPTHEEIVALHARHVC